MFALILAGLCLGLFPFSAGAFPHRQFQSATDFAAWRGEGIEAGGPGPGGLQVQGGKEFRLFSPPGLGIPAAEKPYLRICFRPQSPRYLRAFWLDKAGQPVLVSKVVQPPFDQHFHTFWIPLAENAKHRGTLETLGLFFGGHPGWVEINSIEILPFSLGAYLNDQWQELWLPRNLHPGIINSLNSPSLLNKPFISWLNRLALLVILVGVVLYFKASNTGRKIVVARIAVAILLIWMVYDIRETYNQYKIVEDIYRSYVKPPLEEKTFPSLGDFYRFVGFCRHYIPDNSVFELLPNPYWPFDCRLKYFLYPARMEREIVTSYFRNLLPKYFIVYNAPGIIYDPGTSRLMTIDGKTIYSKEGTLVSRFNPTSFIYKAAEGN